MREHSNHCEPAPALSGWWVLPSAVIGALGWIAIFYFGAPAIASAFDGRPAGCEAYRGAEVAACVAELR